MLYQRICIRSVLVVVIFSLVSMLPRNANATVVEFQTVLGDFEVNLFDNATPATVANFLNYLNSGAYTNTVYHRSVPGFIIQGGGLTYDMALPLNAIPTNAPVVNEPEFSNIRGTIAMAKLSGDPDSATNQWFFNLVNNSADLDGQNGGFTVFGQVVGNGMDVIDAIAALPTYGFASPLGELPLQNYTTTDFNNNVTVDDTHLVIVTGIVISDSTVDTAAALSPAPNTTNSGGGPTLSGDGGGGSLGFFALFFLLLGYSFRKNCQPDPSLL